MKLAITDANIFIDLFHVDLVDKFFQLEVELYTSLEVLFELEDLQQESLQRNKNLTILTDPNPDYLNEIEESLSQRLSLADLSIFHHAQALEAGILTGDSLLKKISQEHGFEVHGILWILDELLVANHLRHQDAIDKLNTLMDYNKRLPISECKKRITRWSRIL